MYIFINIYYGKITKTGSAYIRLIVVC